MHFLSSSSLPGLDGGFSPTGNPVSPGKPVSPALVGIPSATLKTKKQLKNIINKAKKYCFFIELILFFKK